MSQRNESQNSERKIYVGGLPWETRTEGLRKFFQQFGEIIHANVVLERPTGRSRGFGFVTFTDAESATRACVNENPIIDGRVATCRLVSSGDNVNQNQSNQTGFRHDDLCYLAPSFWLNQQQPLTTYVEPYWNQHYQNYNSQWQYHPQYQYTPQPQQLYPQYGPQYYPVVNTNQPYWPQQPIYTADTDSRT